MKEVFHDGVIDIYSGSQPADADDAPTGVKLCRITLAGGAFTEGVESTKRVDTVTIQNAVNTNDYVLVINGTSYTYTADGADTTTTIAAGLAALSDASPVVDMVAVGAVITSRAIFAGIDYTIANTGSTVPGDVVIAAVTANARINGLHWADSVLGVLSKEAGTWEGTNLATGTAGYFRFKANAVDDDTDSTTLVRMDGNISTSNAPLIIAGSVNLQLNATTTIQSATVGSPKS
jgi:phage tail sheath gpL-like